MFEFKHPKYYKELRKLRNKLDRAISSRNRDGECERAPDSGLKQQAPSNKLQAASDKPQAPSYKHQAPSFSNNKLQASSPKQQASSSKPRPESSMIREPRNI